MVLTVKALLLLVLLLKVRLPVPVEPPEMVKSASLFTLIPLAFNVVPPDATVMAVVLMVSGEVALFSLIVVTLLPTPPLMVAVPVPVPKLVIVPALLTDAVERVMPPVLLALRVRF